MRYLVTGAAGFVGSHLCAALLKRNGTVWALDDLSKGRPERLAPLGRNLRFHFLQGSIAQRLDALAEIIETVDVIYHLAAVVGVKNYVEDPVRVVEVNVCETLALMKLAWSHGKKVVFTSTSEVYGKNNELPFTEDADRVYGPAGTDRWCYAVAKSAAEHICLGYARRGLPVVILRYFNVYGPGADSSEYGGVVSRFISQALADQPLTVHGDGNQTRSFTYIYDIVRGTIAAGKRTEAEGKIFNLGSNEEISILQLARLILQLTGKKGKIIFQPYSDFYGPHYEDMRRRVPDTSAAGRCLDFKARTPLREGLMKTLEWYRIRIGGGF